MPKISVIMGVFNTPKDYIKASIDSILNQTYSNFEFIICNDGCTDDSFDYIKKTFKDDRIVLLENESNRGLAYTLNHCLEYAKGDYIARMDTDDISNLNRFEEQVKVLDNYSEIGVVNSNINVFDEKGIYGERIYNQIITKKDFVKNNPIVHPVVMVRKECYQKVDNYRDEKKTYRNEDYDLFMRMFAEGINMYTVQKKLLNFREDKNSYKRRKYKYRINEYLVRVENFKKLGLLPKYYLYCLKPLIVGLVPVCVIKKLRN